MYNDEHPYSNEFREGVMAFHDGKGKADCIYSVGDPIKRADWLAGWEYAYRQETIVVS